MDMEIVNLQEVLLEFNSERGWDENRMSLAIGLEDEMQERLDDEMHEGLPAG